MKAVGLSSSGFSKLSGIGSICLMFLFMIVISSGIANAWGVSYFTNGLQMKAGQSAEVSYELQNFENDETMRIRVSIEGNSEIAQIVGEKEFDLPPKTKEVSAKIKVSIPDDAYAQYELNIKFLALAGQSGFSINSAKVIPLKITVVDGSGQAPLNSPAAEIIQQTNLAEEKLAVENSIQAKLASDPVSKLSGQVVSKGGSSDIMGSVLSKFGILTVILFLAAAGYWMFTKTKRVELM